MLACQIKNVINTLGALAQAKRFHFFDLIITYVILYEWVGGRVFKKS
jgi:hypothetical protein